MSIFFIVLLAILGANADPPQKIIGGEEAEENEFPYMVSLRLRETNDHFCGGAILDDKHILTAAHCFADIADLSEIIVVVGTNWISRGGIGYTVKDIFLSPKFHYGKPFALYDVAIVILEIPLDLNNPNLKNIKMASRRYSAGTPAIFAGWGNTIVNATEKNDKLMKLQTKLASVEDCEDSELYFLEHYHVCILPINGTSACKGDSGGPLVVEDEVVGIVSFGIKCQSVSVFADIVEYRSTIDDLFRCEMTPDNCRTLSSYFSESSGGKYSEEEYPEKNYPDEEDPSIE